MSSRPVLNIKRSRLDIAIEIISIAGVILSIILLISQWSAIPDTIPIHFNLVGKSDRMGSKLTLLLFPAIGLVNYILLTVINRFPNTFNYPWPITEENYARQYQIAQNLLKWLKLEMVWLFTFIEWQTVRVATGKSLLLNAGWLVAIIGIIIGSVGYYFWQAYRDR